GSGLFSQLGDMYVAQPYLRKRSKIRKPILPSTARSIERSKLLPKTCKLLNTHGYGMSAHGSVGKHTPLNRQLPTHYIMTKSSYPRPLPQILSKSPRGTSFPCENQMISFSALCFFSPTVLVREVRAQIMSGPVNVEG